MNSLVRSVRDDKKAASALTLPACRLGKTARCGVYHKRSISVYLLFLPRSRTYSTVSTKMITIKNVIITVVATSCFTEVPPQRPRFKDRLR